MTSEFLAKIKEGGGVKALSALFRFLGRMWLAFTPGYFIKSGARAKS